MNGHWMIKRVETVLGTPVRHEGQWFGNFNSKEEAIETGRQMAERESISGIAIKFEIQFMK